MLTRGGTSKGAYFLADDLPDDPAERDDLLLRVLGSPGPRQIDGIGGAHPLARLILAPDWRTVTWTEAERAKGQAWGLRTIASFHTHGTPPVTPA
jgi:hypothetical protein